MIRLLLALALSWTMHAGAQDAVQPDRFPRGVFSYRGEFGPVEKSSPFRTELIVTDVPSGVLVTETAQLPGNRTGVEEVLLDRSTLVVKRRVVTFGEGGFALDFDRTEARGTIKMKGEDRPLQFPMEGPIFADGGGAFAVLGALPLRVGLEHTFRNLDISKRAATRHGARVIGRESVQTSAGTFDAFRLEVASDPRLPTDPIEIWIDAESRVLVRVRSAATRYELEARRAP